MNIYDILDENHIIIDNTLSSKKSLLDLASQLLASSISDLNASDIFQAFLGREKLGSTGIGHNVAIPHARIDNLKQPLAVFIKLEKGIDFGSIDSEPVDLIFAFIVPKKDNETHLTIISSIASLLEKESIRNKIRNIHNHKALAHFLLNADEIT